METIGQRIKRMREERKLSQRQLAALCKCSDVAILKLEKGESKTPSARILMQLVNVFNKSERYILYGEDGEIVIPSETQQELIQKFDKLTPDQQKSIMAIIDGLTTR